MPLLHSPLKIIFFIAAILLLYLMVHMSSVQQIIYQEQIDVRELSEMELIDRQFNPKTGSHIALEKLIKQYLPNPHTYQHIDSYFIKNEDQLTVYTKYSSVRENDERIQASAIVIYHLNGLLINLLRVD